jgi:MYXO-CTERM domain-containing protein
MFIKRLIVIASTSAILLIGSSAHASLFFNFDGVIDDGDRFNAVFETNDNLITQDYMAHTNVAAGLTSPAYTFTGYEIIRVSGFWFEHDDPNTALDILDLLPALSIIENDPRNGGSLDDIAHGPTDNLFNPNFGFLPSIGGIAGKLSYGGVAFLVGLPDGSTESYQLFTDPVSLGYAGCPGSCSLVTEVPTPNPLPLLGLGLALVWLRRIRRRITG